MRPSLQIAQPSTSRSIKDRTFHEKRQRTHNLSQTQKHNLSHLQLVNSHNNRTVLEKNMQTSHIWHIIFAGMCGVVEIIASPQPRVLDDRRCEYNSDLFFFSFFRTRLSTVCNHFINLESRQKFKLNQKKGQWLGSN